MPVQFIGIAHAIENQMSTARDLPSFMIENDSAVLISQQFQSGTIPRPSDTSSWTLRPNVTNGTWNDVFDIQAKYSFAYISVALSDGEYGLFWYQEAWYRQYTAKTYQVNQYTTHEMSRLWYMCPKCSLRNLPTLFMDMYHYMFHDRSDMYFGYNVDTRYNKTQDHRLSISVSRSNGM